ncbi:MAG TPA: phage terminase large subunit family protein [Planctomycetota bacterium]|nr:phage terminase large subunit family protein [Planctomycetota bacterium]HRT95534.1 phage terminase large subunit family protein [Planctomycetota bacterium]
MRGSAHPGLDRSAVLAALRPPRRVLPSEWVGDNRRLTRDSSPEPGPFRLDRTPYWREPLDKFADPFVRKITAVTATQVGKTDGLMANTVGWAVDVDPAPGVYGMPRDPDIAYLLRERFRKSFEVSPGFRRHLDPASWISLTDQVMSFDTMPLYFLSAASPAALASKPARYAWLDEVDKWPRFSGREADPVSLILERTKNFHDRKIVQCSTPTLKSGYIWVEFEASQRHEYWVPCAHCGRYQLLTWNHLKFSETERDPKRIEDERLAWCECEHCHGRIGDTQKPAMLLGGRWVPEGCEIDASGNLVGEVVPASHVGYHLSAIYSPWVTFSQIVAEFLRSKDAPEKLMNWRNSWMAEPWEERGASLSDEQLLVHVGNYERGTVPTAVQVLTAAVDVHDPGHPFRVVVRGWGHAEESFLVVEAEAESWQAVEELVCVREYPRTSGGERLRVVMAGIDARYRTNEVYEFCRAWSEIVRPVFGQPGYRMSAPFKPSVIDYHPRKGRVVRNGLVIWHVNTDYYKDKLLALMSQPVPTDPGYFWLCSGVTDGYAKEMAAEHRVPKADRHGRTRMVWEVKYRGVGNHAWDAEVYDLAIADMAGALNLPRQDGAWSADIAPHRGEEGEPFVRRGGGWWDATR